MRSLSICVVLFLAWLSPALAAQPSFDCTKAGTTTEHLLCERAPLAELDVELAGLYRQALARSANPSALRRQQSQWLAERDRACIAQRTLAQVREDLSADTCLRRRYGARIALLRAQVAPPLQLTGLASAPDEATRAIGLATPGCEARQGALAPDGQSLAVEMDCAEAGRGRRFWMLSLTGGPAVAASPELGPAQLRSATAGLTGAHMLWSGPRLVIATAVQDIDGQFGPRGAWQPLSLVASLQTLRQDAHANLPAALTALQQAQAAAHRAAEGLQDDGWLPGSERQVAGQLVWLSDQGRGRLILRSRLSGTTATRDLQEGSWELRHLLSDDAHLIYPSNEGVMVQGMASGSARRVEDTTAGDWPLAWQPATRTLVWSSPRMCGMTRTPERAARELCHAVLDAPR